MAKPYVGRFAPSPTGHLHFGSLFVAIVSYLDAKSQGGRWLIRIDDLDPDRCKPEFTTSLLTTLAQFELCSDAPILFQSQRSRAYRAAAYQLYQEKHLYPCSCSRKKLSAYKGVYPGFCRRHSPPIAWPLHPGSALALRIKTSPETQLKVKDIWRQTQISNTTHIGDFIVYRRDQVATYSLATVLDDAHQEITYVIRGSDLLEETFKQNLLQQTLKLPQPEYGHLPLIVNKNGQKLSKQNRASPIRADEARFDPMRYLAQLEPYLGVSIPKHTDHPKRWLALATDTWRRNQIPEIQQIVR